MFSKSIGTAERPPIFPAHKLTSERVIFLFKIHSVHNSDFIETGNEFDG